MGTHASFLLLKAGASSRPELAEVCRRYAVAAGCFAFGDPAKPCLGLCVETEGTAGTSVGPLKWPAGEVVRRVRAADKEIGGTITGRIESALAAAISLELRETVFQVACYDTICGSLAIEWSSGDIRELRVIAPAEQGWTESRWLAEDGRLVTAAYDGADGRYGAAADEGVAKASGHPGLRFGMDLVCDAVIGYGDDWCEPATPLLELHEIEPSAHAAYTAACCTSCGSSVRSKRELYVGETGDICARCFR